MEFHILGFHVVIIMDSRPHQIQAVKFVQQCLAGLKRILWGNDEPDLFNIGGFNHHIGYDEMTGMDGVKRTEEKAYFHKRTESRPDRFLPGEIIVQALGLPCCLLQVTIDYGYIELVLKLHYFGGFVQPSVEHLL